jgi:hypothetical protein
MPNTYTYVRMAANADCKDGAPSNTFTVVVHAVPSVSVSGGNASQTVGQGTAITPIVYTASNATTIYHTGSLPADVSSSVTNNTTLNIYGTPSAMGTFGYTVASSHTNGCVSAVATGTITVTIPTTLCTQCCWNGSTWVDCYVTTNAYPFDNTSINTPVVWSGNSTTFYSGASGLHSDKNGRVNTDAISSTSTAESAVGVCKALGTGWYLPAYEELYAMSSGAANAASNNRAGANLLAMPSGYYWSSTEHYNNGGRDSNSDTSYQSNAVLVYTNGGLSGNFKSGAYYYVRCAWRN